MLYAFLLNLVKILVYEPIASLLNERTRVKVSFLLMFTFLESTLLMHMLENTIPSPLELVQKIPLPPSSQKKIEEFRNTAKDILLKNDSRLLLIVGPCSVHDLKAMYEYATYFQKLAKEVSDQFFLVLRTYLEKPRSAKGWKGFLNDPYLDNSCDIASGLRLARQLLVDLTAMGIPLGSELLEIHTTPYLTDLLTWGCIGARTCTSQPHRQLVASLDIPIGFKNTTDGNIENAIHGILAAQSSHYFLGVNSKGAIQRLHAQGNPYCHVVLRGSEKGPNYDPASIADALKQCEMAKIHPSLVVDCSHDNCGKRHNLQAEVFQSVIQQVLEGNSGVTGLMLESHLQEGNQPMSLEPRYGVSLTDPCLGWKATEKLITWGAETLSSHRLALMR